MTTISQQKQKCSFDICDGSGVYEVPECAHPGEPQTMAYLGKEVACPCKMKNYDEYDNQLD